MAQTNDVKHTPGPWKKHRVPTGLGASITISSQHDTKENEGTRIIASVVGYREQSEADANLIAAAPDLLAACEEATYLFAHGIGASNEFVREHNIEAGKKIMEQLRVAIAKAKGEAQ